MKYVEMYGLPGAGKTTISVPVINRLLKEGYKVAGLSDVYFRHCSKGRKAKVLFEIVLSIRNYPLFFRLIQYGLTVSLKADCIRSLFKLIFLVHQLIRTINEEKYDLILIEEGIVQYMSSLCYTDELPDNKSLRCCLSKIIKKTNIVAVNCDISIEESFSRINNRQETSRRYSAKIPSSFLFSVLQKKKKNLSVIAQYLPLVHEISLEKDKEINEMSLYCLVQQEIRKK